MGEKKSRGRRLEKKKEENKVQEHKVDDSDKNIPNTFFGLVDSNEIDYFKQAESTLNINAFESDEDRLGFVSSVLDEASGKELKLVTNQICSKLMERLILFAEPQQLKNIFKQFSGHFESLAFHKYSSHVLETLLVRVAGLIEKEIIEESNEMEELFISMINELKPHLVIMIDHQYASHVLRLLIMILSGKELPSSVMSNSVLRSKKSKIARKMIEIKDNEDFNRSFQTPPSFKNELKSICETISKGLDQTKTRSLSIHKIASPVIQLLIQVEGLVDRERSFWHLIFEKNEAVPSEESYVEYLLSDSVGSHFLEAIIKNDGARPNYIERLYRLYIKDRIAKLSNRTTTGVYIIQALLFKLKPVEVKFILDEIIPKLTEFENLDLASKIIDASLKQNYRRDEIVSQLFLKFVPEYSDTYEGTDLLENVLQLSTSTLGNTRDDWPTAEERKKALFLEKLMEYDYKFVICSWLNFMSLPIERFIQMCLHGVFSHVVEKALIVEPNEIKQVQILRKRFLNIFQGHIVVLACNSYGSHIVDKLWDFTANLPMYKDKIATELMSDSKKVKESTYGKLVWKNWSMELFARKKYDWKALMKEEDGEKVKTPIQLKMEQLAEEKKRKEEEAEKAQSGYNKRKLDELTNNTKKQKARGRNR